MTKTRFLALITALALLLTIPTAVFAQNTIPHVFLGTASLDGATAVDGTAITAWVDGQQVAATNIVGGSYQLVIGGAAGFAGETVVFRVGSANAAETADWTMGGADVLNLTASSQGATTAPPPAGGAGEKGDKGDRGNTGAAGAAGSAGPAGPAGSSGSDGRAGSDGATGETGAAGSPGSPGVAGDDGGGGAIGVIALILAIVAIVAAGGAYMMGRRA